MTANTYLVPPTATEILIDASGNLGTGTLKKCQHDSDNGDDIYALDHACGGTRSKLLRNTLLSSCFPGKFVEYTQDQNLDSVDGESKYQVEIWTPVA